MIPDSYKDLIDFVGFIVSSGSNRPDPVLIKQLRCLYNNLPPWPVYEKYATVEEFIDWFKVTKCL